MLGLFGAVAALPLVSRSTASASPFGQIELADGIVIRPRADWAGSLAPTGPIPTEPDVRFLLVHHTAGTNDYRADEASAVLRSIYSFHTGAEKRWPDVAYNFLVDRYGTVWEARDGSLASLVSDAPAVAGSATGGSQGHALLCCFMGNHETEAPTSEAQRAMVALLARAADRFGVDTAAGANVSFESQGSNRWPAGERVNTSTISGHRQMSFTTCPGDAAFALVAGEFPGRVSQVRSASLAAGPTPLPDAAVSTTAAASPSPTMADAARSDTTVSTGVAADLATTTTASVSSPHETSAVMSTAVPAVVGSATTAGLVDVSTTAGAVIAGEAVRDLSGEQFVRSESGDSVSAGAVALVGGLAAAAVASLVAIRRRQL